MEISFRLLHDVQHGLFAAAAVTCGPMRRFESPQMPHTPLHLHSPWKLIQLVDLQLIKVES